jgi:hypothetical protein
MSHPPRKHQPKNSQRVSPHVLKTRIALYLPSLHTLDASSVSSSGISTNPKVGLILAVNLTPEERSICSRLASIRKFHNGRFP